MKSILKGFTFFALGLFLLFVLLIIGVTNFVDPTEFKSTIAKTVREQTEWELTVDGKIAWRFLPDFAIAVEGVRLQTALGTPLIAAKTLAISPKLWPLFRGEIEIDDIELTEFNLRYEIDETGKNNWQTGQANAARLDDPARFRGLTSSTVCEVDEAGQNPLGGLVLNIDQISLRQGVVDFQDRSNPAQIQAYRISEFDLVVNQLNFNRAFPVEFKLLVSDQQSPLKIDLDVSLQLQITQALNQFNFQDVQLKAVLFGLNERDPAAAIDLLLKGDLQQDSSAIQWQLSELKVDDLTLRTDGRLGLDEVGNLAAKIVSDNFDPQPLLKKIGVEYQPSNPAMLKALQLDMAIAGTLAQWQSEKLQIKIDQTQLSGMLGGRQFSRRPGAEPQWAWQLQLNGDQINIDDYMAKSESQNAWYLPPTPDITDHPLAATDYCAAQTTDTPLPLAELAALQLAAKLNFNSMRFNAINLSQPSLNLEAKNGDVNFQFSTDSLSGRIQHSGRLKTDGKTATLESVGDIAAIELAQLQPIFKQPMALLGRASLKSKFNGKGGTVESLLDSLQANFLLTVADGVVQEKSLSAFLAAIKPLLNKPIEKDSLNFKALGADFSVIAGLKQQRLTLNLDNVNLEGQGSFDIRTDDFKYAMALKILASTAPLIKVNEKFIGKSIPFSCEGNLNGDAAKWCRVEIANLLKNELKERLDQKKTEKLDELKEKVPEKYRDLLDIFK